MPIQSGERFIADEGLGSVSATVSSLPVGFNLGEERVNAGIRYKLCFNAGNSAIDAGKVAVPVSGASIASVTVTSTSQGNGHIGGVVAVHATVATANYFWGAFKGTIPGMVGDAASIPTGSALCVGDAGTIQLMPQSVVTGKLACGIVITTVSNGGAKSGSAYVSFL